MKKLNILLASALLCLTFSISALAGHTPISNVTGEEPPITTKADGHTPISNFSGSSETKTSDFKYQVSSLIMNEILYNLMRWR